MPLSFSVLCGLLEQLAGLKTDADSESVLSSWFANHVSHEDHRGRAGLALASSLLPALRPDRVYGMREKRLSDLVVKTWLLGITRAKELQRLQDLQSLDLASVVEIVLGPAIEPHGEQPELSVEDVDHALDLVAFCCPFWAHEVRKNRQPNFEHAMRTIQHCLRRMTSQEAKLTIRLLLKDLFPAKLPEQTVLRLLHPSRCDDPYLTR